MNLIISPDSSRQFYTMLGYAQFQKRLYFQPKKNCKVIIFSIKNNIFPIVQTYYIQYSDLIDHYYHYLYFFITLNQQTFTMHTENHNPLWTADRAILPYKRTQIIQKNLKVALNKIKTYSNQNQTLNEQNIKIKIHIKWFSLYSKRCFGLQMRTN